MRALHSIWCLVDSISLSRFLPIYIAVRVEGRCLPMTDITVIFVRPHTMMSSRVEVFRWGVEQGLHVPHDRANGRIVRLLIFQFQCFIRKSTITQRRCHRCCCHDRNRLPKDLDQVVIVVFPGQVRNTGRWPFGKDWSEVIEPIVTVD